MSDTNPYIDIARLVAAGIVGGLVATFAAHKLAISRDRASGRATRKREFLGFMQAWRFEVSRHHNTGAGFAPDIGIFVDGISRFREQVEMIRNDLRSTHKRRLDELVVAVQKCDVYDNSKTLKTLDDVIGYVETAA